MAKKKNDKKTSKKENKYKLSIKIMGKTFNFEGDSLLEIFQDIQVDNLKGVAVFTVSNGENTRIKIINTNNFKKLVSPNKLVRQVAVKNTLSLFENL